MSDEETFEQVDAGAADCYPVRAGEVKKGQFVVIKGHPCKVTKRPARGRKWSECGPLIVEFSFQVVDYSTSKTGKHGHAKAKIVAIDIFTGKKLEDVAPTSHNMYAPNGETATDPGRGFRDFGGLAEALGRVGGRVLVENHG